MGKWIERVKSWFHLIPDETGRDTQAPTRPLLSRPLWWMVLILLMWLPISAFLVTVTGWRYVSLIRDIITLALLIGALISRRRNGQTIVAGDVERLVVWLVVWSLISLAFITRDPSAWMWSARYSLAPLAVFWALHSFAVTSFQWRRLMTIWLSWTGLLFLFGLAMVFIIPPETLIAWGYSSTVAIGNGQWVGGASLPAYQAVAGGIPRLQATLTGPIQLAGFGAIVLFMLRTAARWQPTWFWQKTLFVLTVLMILGTFSRSVWLALIIIGAVAAFRRLRAQGLRRRDLAAWGTVTLVGVVATLGLIFMSPNNEALRFSVGRILAREGSDSEHAASITDSLADWKQVGFWGLGFGRSGPGSIQHAAANPQAPLPRFVDNSYLRWWEELGIPGVALFLAMIWILISELRLAGPIGRNLAGAGLTLALASLLTDMWAEAVPLYTFLILAALWHQEPSRDLQSVNVGRFTISAIDLPATMRRLSGWTKKRDPHAVVTLNPEMYVAAAQHKAVAEALVQADLITADGSGLVAAADVARQINGSKILRWRWLKVVWLPAAWLWSGLRLIFAPNRLPLSHVTGADLVSCLINKTGSEKPRVALIGSTEEVMEKIKYNFSIEERGMTVVLARPAPGYTTDTVPPADVTKFAKLLSPLHADYLFVAFGVPRQERFIIENRRTLGVPVMIGVSGAFDSVLAGTVHRAPRLLQALHIEWLWRLILQPKRIGRIWTATWRFVRVASRDIIQS